MKQQFLFGLLLTGIAALGQQADRINIAVMDLDNRGNFEKNEMNLFTDRINSEILKNSRFVVVERQQIDRILQEQGFQQSGACDSKECLVEMGQILAVQKVIGGSIGKIEGIYPLTIKLIDVRTGEIEAQVVKDIRGSKTDVLSKHIPEMTAQLLKQAGYGPKVAAVKKKNLIRKPGFFIPVIALVAGGGVAAAVLLNSDDEGDGGDNTGVQDIDITDFPDHVITPNK